MYSIPLSSYHNITNRPMAINPPDPLSAQRDVKMLNKRIVSRNWSAPELGSRRHPPFNCVLLFFGWNGGKLLYSCTMDLGRYYQFKFKLFAVLLITFVTPQQRPTHTFHRRTRDIERRMEFGRKWLLSMGDTAYPILCELLYGSKIMPWTTTAIINNGNNKDI